MKKILALILATVMAFSVAACGGGEEETTTTTTTEVVEEVTLVERTTGNVSMLLPSDFSEFEDFEGFPTAIGEGAVVTVSEMAEYAGDSTEFTEDDFYASVEGVYENVEIKEFTLADINGVTGLCITFIGDSVSSGTTRSVLYVLYDTTDGTNLYNNSICFMFNTNDGTNLEKYFEDVLNSLSVL